VVRANSQFYFLGDDGNLYSTEGGSLTLLAPHNRALTATITHPEDVYGFDFIDEHVVRWFAPSDGRVLVYDYAHDLLSEDTRWIDGGAQMLPIGAAGRFGHRQLIGLNDRSGTIAEWTPSARTDDGLPIRVERSTVIRLSETGEDCRVNALRLELKRGEGKPLTGEAGELQVRWRLDRDLQQSVLVDLGAIGDRYPAVDLTGLGIGKLLELSLVQTDAVDFLPTAAFLTVEGLGR
jgi:hypothetical protein